MRMMKQHTRQSATARRERLPSLIALIILLGWSSASDAARIKDLANIRGVRSNQLVGYGLVVGLDGTGDDQAVYFTLQSVQQMLRRLGVPASKQNVFDLRNLKLRNTAAVMVTASLPPFARAGTRLDVTVSSLGNAKNLAGGVLLMTPLRGVDLKVYAMAQGALTTGGFAASGGSGSKTQKNHPTVGTVPRAGIVEREVPSRFVVQRQLVVALRRPDFTTASRVASAVNAALGEHKAQAVDPATVVVKLAGKISEGDAVGLVSRIEALQVNPDAEARVIINERTGTVIVGQEVRLSRVAIAHGSLTIEINERFAVSQPDAPFGSKGAKTEVVPETKVTAKEKKAAVQLVERTASLADVVKALNALGASPRDLVAIFQGLSAAGALPAKLVVQ